MRFAVRSNVEHAFVMRESLRGLRTHGRGLIGRLCCLRRCNPTTAAPLLAPRAWPYVVAARPTRALPQGARIIIPRVRWGGPRRVQTSRYLVAFVESGGRARARRGRQTSGASDSRKCQKPSPGRRPATRAWPYAAAPRPAPHKPAQTRSPVHPILDRRSRAPAFWLVMSTE